MSLKKLTKKMSKLARSDKAERFVAQNMLVATADRIFEKGQDANNSSIGKYSAAYLKQRQKEGYPSSKKVILQATRQMGNDWSVVAEGGKVGLGFKNQKNANKSHWVEETYNTPIFSHTKRESKQAVSTFSKYVKKQIR